MTLESIQPDLNLRSEAHCVFISHANEDRAYVDEHLIPVLKEAQISYWYSPQSIQSAQDWEQEIRNGLERCDWILVIISESSVRSKWVAAEVAWAVKHRAGFIVPICIDETLPETVNLQLIRVHHADWRIHPDPHAVLAVIASGERPMLQPSEHSRGRVPTRRRHVSLLIARPLASIAVVMSLVAVVSVFALPRNDPRAKLQDNDQQAQLPQSDEELSEAFLRTARTSPPPDLPHDHPPHG